MKQTTVAGLLVTATVGVVVVAVVLYFTLRWNFRKYEVSVAVFLIGSTVIYGLSSVIKSVWRPSIGPSKCSRLRAAAVAIINMVFTIKTQRLFRVAKRRSRFVSMGLAIL